MAPPSSHKGVCGVRAEAQASGRAASPPPPAAAWRAAVGVPTTLQSRVSAPAARRGVAHAVRERRALPFAGASGPARRVSKQTPKVRDFLYLILEG